MSGPLDFTNENIENTYQRVLQTDGTLIYDGTGSLFTVTAIASPAGPNQSIQFNDSGTTSGSGNFTFDKNTNIVNITGSINASSGFTGSLLGTAATASFTPNAVVTASINSNIITFTKGDGSTFPLTVDTGSGGTSTPGSPEQSIQFNSGSTFSGSTNLKFDYINNNIILTGSLLVTQSHISTIDYIDFTILDTALPHQEGRVHWVDDTKTINVDTDVNDFYIELGHQQVVRVYNPNTFTLTKGTVVYISGSQGTRPSVVTASFQSDQLSAATLGLVVEDIVHTGGTKTGYVVTSGILRGINTNLYPPGTQLYLSSSGTFSNQVPDAPLHEVRLGKVITQGHDGIIYVDVMNGYELTELHDVKTTTYNNGDLLIHSSSLWVNSKQLTGSYGLTGSLTFIDGGLTGSLFGTSSWAQSASNALSSSLSQTASFYQETDPIFIAKSASFATTGSNIFIGNQTVSGSIFITGSTQGSGSGHILTYNTASGEVFFTASSAIGGGGGTIDELQIALLAQCFS